MQCCCLMKSSCKILRKNVNGKLTSVTHCTFIQSFAESRCSVQKKNSGIGIELRSVATILGTGVENSREEKEHFQTSFGDFGSTM